MKSTQKLVSIVVPVYNVQKYLREAVDSVCAQTYPVWELLLVDDGSTDQSGAICDEYAQKDERIRVFHTGNRGVSCARNLGIENAKGHWIAFLDSDDYLNKDCLETSIRYSTDMEMVVYSTQNVPTGKFAVLSDSVAYYASLQDTQKELARFRSYFYSSVWNKLYLRDKMTMRFNPSLSLNEDWCFNAEYMQNCHGICVLPDILNYHRVSTENSLTKKFRMNAIEDGSTMFHAQLRLFGDSQHARVYRNENFAREVVKQSVRLARDQSYSLREKKAILAQWASHPFWQEDAMEISLIPNRRQGTFLYLLKHKRILTALLLCQVSAAQIAWKERHSKA